MLKAGRTSAGAKAASSHTGALAGNDKIYEDVLKQSGVIRARCLRQLLEFARGVPVLPTPKGENVLIITGAGGSGVLLSDSVVDNGLSLMAMPPDLDAAFRKFIPPFGAAGNPVDITGGEPPITYVNTVKLGLSDERIHSLILGYWHTIVTPPMVFARNMVEVKKEMEAKGFVKPIVASLAGDVEVEEAAEYLYQNGIPAYRLFDRDCRSRCSAPSTNGRAARACCKSRHEIGLAADDPGPGGIFWSRGFERQCDRPSQPKQGGDHEADAGRERIDDEILQPRMASGHAELQQFEHADQDDGDAARAAGAADRRGRRRARPGRRPAHARRPGRDGNAAGSSPVPALRR